MHTFSTDSKVYLVDLMIMFLQNKKLKQNYNIVYKFININKIKNQMKQKCWVDNNNKSITPNKVILNPKLYIEHWNRIIKADLRHPIIISKDIDTSKIIIIDGFHRLSKAFLSGKKTIRVYDFSNLFLETFYIGEKKKFSSLLKFYSKKKNIEKLLNIKFFN